MASYLKAFTGLALLSMVLSAQAHADQCRYQLNSGGKIIQKTAQVDGCTICGKTQLVLSEEGGSNLVPGPTPGCSVYKSKDNDEILACIPNGKCVQQAGYEFDWSSSAQRCGPSNYPKTAAAYENYISTNLLSKCDISSVDCNADGTNYYDCHIKSSNCMRSQDTGSLWGYCPPAPLTDKYTPCPGFSVCIWPNSQGLSSGTSNDGAVPAAGSATSK